MEQAAMLVGVVDDAKNGSI